MRLRPRAGDFDGEERACACLAEEQIDWLESDALPSGHGLRDLRLQPRNAMEVDFLGIETVISLQMDGGAGHSKNEVGKMDEAVAQLEVPAERGEDVRDLFVFGLALRTTTQHVNLLLDGPAGE